MSDLEKLPSKPLICPRIRITVTFDANLGSRLEKFAQKYHCKTAQAALLEAARWGLQVSELPDDKEQARSNGL